MASETSNNSGHLSTGSVVTREDRPPGPVPKHHLAALGKKDMQTAPQGVSIDKAPSIKGGW